MQNNTLKEGNCSQSLRRACDFNRLDIVKLLVKFDLLAQLNLDYNATASTGKIPYMLALPHQINYIGSFLVSNLNGIGSLNINDNFATDKALIQKKLPRVSLDSYKNNTAKTNIEDK